MKIAASLFSAILLAGTVLSAPAQAEESPATADDTATQLFSDYQAWQQENSWRPGALPSVTPEAQQERAESLQGYLSRLDEIDQESLSPAQRVNTAVFRSVVTERLGDAAFREWQMPLNSDSNFWSYLNPASGFRTADQYRNYIARMREIPRYFDEHIANARSGLERGFSVPRVTLEGRDVSVEAYLAEGRDNPFFAAIAQMPDSFDKTEKTAIEADALEAIETAIIPAYRTLLTFLREEYVPGARTTLAAHDMPDGEAYYAQQIRQYTTLDLTAEQIHQTGLAEVARIEAAMRAIMAEVGFEGSIAEFNESLRTDPRFIADTPDELMGVASYVAKRVDGEMGKYFGFLPRHRFSIRPVAPDIAPFYTAGRGGYEFCQMNTYDLPSRPLYNIPALTLHECVPGHSFQAAFQNEQGRGAEGAAPIPAFRRNIYFSGMGEGWGLYTEFLGEEMGIYRTPYERFGRLSYEMWRAARLVIDTGIHSKGWSRDKAVQYLADRTALSRHEVGTEIDRYISWPGQALSYKLGEMQIRRLRKEAETALGENFDIRKFHDVILALGSVPLPVLEQRIKDFIADGGQGVPDGNYN